ncbi:uncharacterized protein LTR77_001740 [Saxophila tyrrhenica]|uniref:Uncharacterized protein n=1 Tax=Saxophila tyrrhenica TaxID=1690608 RepID=A0AAV9PLA5_9PEZI|nr:hypothetical protein LTR77_001740 [Saxophila tyrrhenica]
MSDLKHDPSFSYQSVNPTPEHQISEDEAIRPQIELGAHPQMARKRGSLATIIWQTIALLWLVPVVALLYLNFTEYIIGASAWCPKGQCWLDMFNPNQAIPRQRAREFNKASHDLLGGLQFVAKALEVWFGIIAAALMYILTMKAAGYKEGLPVGYLTRPLEFADPITLLDPLLWKTGPSPFGKKSAADKRVGLRVWQLIGLSLFLCVLINLMGPATAVLVIPALNIIPTAKVGQRVFQGLNAAEPPSTRADSWIWWNLHASTHCTKQEIQAKNYSCTLTPFGDSMDAWVSTYIASDGDAGITTQLGLSFAANYTSKIKTDNAMELLYGLADGKQQYKDYTWWTPNRQVITNLYNDYLAVKLLSFGFTKKWITNHSARQLYDTDPIKTYVEYNKSLELSLLRDGVVLGAVPTKWADYNFTDHWVLEVDANRQVRCYDNYDLRFTALSTSSWTGKYTRCIRTGSGWSSENKKAQFFTDQIYNNATGNTDPGVDITVYTSDKAAYFKDGKRPSWIPAPCLSVGRLLNNTICPWERIFTADEDSDVFNRTQHSVTVEFYMGNGSSDTHFVVDFVPYYDFTMYSLNANPVSNPAKLVQTADLPVHNALSFAMDPNWYVAAWSTSEQGSLFANRTTTQLLQNTMQSQLQNPSNDWIYNQNYDYLALIPTLQALSLIDYSTAPVDSHINTKDPARPILSRWAQMYVWSYGIGSRTSELGVAVAIAGCLVVLWQVVLGLADRRRYRSPTQLVVAALEHSPRGEFEGKGHNEVEMARVRFHIRDNDSQVGKFSFYEPEEKEQGGEYGTVVH